jgi:uncharacterized protein YgbK (DUF1537 family)
MSDFPIAVIADDLSGAAELAGIAVLQGLTAEVQTRFQPESNAQVVTVDTDSRGLAASEGAAKVHKAAQEVAAIRPAMIFKKVDSVLRGNVRAEIESILAATGLERAILAPANPSRGRTIEGGQYRVYGVPLDQTEFARDPEHPRLTADVAALLGGPAKTITIPDAASMDDLDRIARSQGERTLAAGAADFFAALLGCRGYPQGIAPTDALRLAPPAILVCGSITAWKARSRECAHAALPLLSLDSPGDGFLDRAMQMLESHNALVLAPGEVVATPDQRCESFDRYAAAAAELLRSVRPATVLAEGGATAAALASRLGWTRMTTVATAPAGVGVLRPLDCQSSPLLLIKPGSYPWPEPIWRQFVELR